mgnify:CR=1 FL=1
MSNLEKTIAKAFLEMAEGLETGSFGPRPKIAITGMGSEHGEENAMKAARMAAARGVDVYYIGTLEAEGVTTVHVANEDEGHKKKVCCLQAPRRGAQPPLYFRRVAMPPRMCRWALFSSSTALTWR